MRSRTIRKMAGGGGHNAPGLIRVTVRRICVAQLRAYSSELKKKNCKAIVCDDVYENENNLDLKKIYIYLRTRRDLVNYSLDASSFG